MKITKTFVVIEALLYVAFILLDLMNVDSWYLKYLGILLCFIYCLIYQKKIGTIALSLTCVADFFLLVIDKYYLIGVVVFLVVQTCYIFYLYKEDIKPFLFIRVILSLLLIFILYEVEMLDYLNACTVVYFSQLLISCVLSFRNKKLRLFSIGLSLFVCCDICVGLHNIFIYNYLIAILQWVFYLPSQVLIAYSISK